MGSLRNFPKDWVVAAFDTIMNMTQPQIENDIKKLIFKHLSPKKYKVFVYGSRATGRARKWSDYDIGIMGKEEAPHAIMANLSEELENSDIPVNVDVVDFHYVSDRFKNLALYKIIPWTT